MLAIMNPISTAHMLAQLKWRYATRKFDPAKKIGAADWAALEESLILTPSSIGLQPWKFFIVTDPAVKAQLVTASWHQAQPADCSHYVVFSVRKNIDEAHVNRHLARMSEVNGLPMESLEKFRKMTVGNLNKARDAGTLDTWQTFQVYIALGSFLAAAAMVGIDACPMEGFEPLKYDEILGLKDTGYASVVACATGYRLETDRHAGLKKVRFKSEDLIVRV